jgi:protein-S-isoprenylcysteine O-methyltransferase Ste14
VKTNDHAGVWFPPPLLFLIPLLSALAAGFRRDWPIVREPASVLPVAGLLVIAIGISVGISSVVSFRDAGTTILPAGRPTTAIVARGPYRFTRNPMYLAMALAYLGLAVLFNNRLALLLLPAVVTVVDRFVIRREERYLEAKFGEAYARYRSRVRRWI